MADNPLKAVVASLDDLDESVQGLYDRQGDGTYALSVEGSLPGFVEKGRVDEFREANIKLTEETKKAADALSKFDGVDVDKYRAWEQSEADLERKNLSEAGQVEELIVNGFRAAQKAAQGTGERHQGAGQYAFPQSSGRGDPESGQCR